MKRRSLLQAVPAAETLEKNLADDSTAYVVGPTYEVLSWRNGPAGSDVPCTEVHLCIPIAEGVKVTLRIKSARALDELVAVLLEYRREVFP